MDKTRSKVVDDHMDEEWVDLNKISLCNIKENDLLFSSFIHSFIIQKIP